ncbi:MAG: hypothetical protein U5Q16_16655 [Gammaproteobacteria bacterium]|nr:hypothetical protein [Gammaproteobacteria bacterium]
MSGHTGPERRKGSGDRRRQQPDRRNPERQADELVPRRNPDQPDRRRRERKD